MEKLYYTLTEKSATVFYGSRTFTFTSDQSKFDDIIFTLTDKTLTDLQKIQFLESLESPRKAVENFSQVLDNKLSIKNDELFYRELKISGYFAEQLLESVKTGKEYQHLVNFFHNVEQNPSIDSRMDLFEFLSKNQFPLTPDGHFIGYKAVREDFFDKYTATIDNSPGMTPTLDWAKVDPDKAVGCSYGLHVGNFSYVQSYGANYNDKMIIVKVNPKDVVSVPFEDHRKVRVCKYLVLNEIPKNYELDYTKLYAENQTPINYFDLV